MDPILIISIFVGLILIMFFIGAPMKPLRFIGQGIVKILIGALFLFFLNEFGTGLGLYVPINLVTATISGLLGIPGVVALVAIENWII
ncbi:pro-sigmaK processing inhibitor BofA family protein [Mesobacillus maritimus]|uniref:pro-sigmaK processing inhibitor BofA family protein n=1 Tax=Mesobacillus maritimus TaxID=1643336 RepID=UPI00203D33CA|nr:pro-sigmaK processing inhibitor BofA family protein [Mesobacillus maritimus]MCM3588902.1 pro-sigmaK processing inhibitor BofA family protein [Mesobacillus maritimus]MCM3672150.1 pro-sigmaK processing inhibitor BofA family protein [Mesobacillus maritimus]